MNNDYRLEGRVVTQKVESERHRKLVAQINSIIEREILRKFPHLCKPKYDEEVI